ncbi:MAG: Crp/Fnr family transcriptional regulator, partial [Bacteroidales bacterium]|nr:Crp/Fnr family transcriptional regulator [Bacteroidales bacterium]
MTPVRKNCNTCLRDSRCFGKLDEIVLEKLKSNRHELTYKKGEIICKQGAYASHVLYILDGSAKTYLEVHEGKNNIISVLPEGELIGLPSLFSSRVYPYTAAALEDCIFCSFDIQLIENLVRTNGLFASRMIKCINDSTIQNYDRYIFNTQRSMKGRLADIFIHLSENIYRSEESRLSLSRNDLAEWTQMAPESVTRILTTFKNEGLISVE